MRRVLIGAFGALLLIAMAVPAGAAHTTGPKGPRLDSGPFPYGVAAFEIHPASSTLWTQTALAKVRYEVATDQGFTTVVRKGTVAVSPDGGGTVLQRVAKLSPNTTYYYRFTDPGTGDQSRIGHFVTAPSTQDDTGFTFDISGDQDGTIDPATGNPCWNTFLSFQTIQNDNPAFYLNLGDTIYSDSVCKTAPGGIGEDVTLDQYRADHAFQLTYDSWRNLRSSAGMYSEWDDHEVRNDFDINTVDPQLLANGKQAFQEWEGVPSWDPNVGFYRTWRWGANAQFFLLDERSFRTTEANRMDVDGDGVEDCYNPEFGDADLAPTLTQSWRNYFAGQFAGTGLENPPPAQCTADLQAAGRTMLGDAQRTRFLRDLATSTATWKFVITEDLIQNLFALPYDRWEGYQWERNQILSSIDTNQIKNVVWLATDIHANLAHTVDYNTPNPGIGQTVQGMVEYSFGPVATATFAKEIDDLLAPGCTTNCPHGQVRGFLVISNKNSCASFLTYGYGRVTIDPGTHQLTISARQENGQPVSQIHPDCKDYVALPS